MDFYTVLDQVIELLRSRGRLSYRALKRQFAMDDELLADLKAELRYARYPVVEDDDQGLVWTGETAPPSEHTPPSPRPETEHAPHAERPLAEPHTPEAERRQLTVLFCDLVDSTVLASQLDPEEWREVVRAYQRTCAAVIQRYDGHIAQYLGDGLLVYFGYPQAHEDDAQRAVRAGLGMVEAMGQLNARLTHERGVRLTIRVGIHTGLVVVGEVGGGGRHEQLALGDTPNIAARIQGIAAPDTVVVSAATFRLVQGVFAAEAMEPQMLKGVATPVRVYRALGDSGALNRFDLGGTRGLTPLVGRELEVALLVERWAQVQEGIGHVVVLSGEPGIGKSRLMEGLKAHAAAAPHTRLECRGSPYHQHSALYPIIETLPRALALARDDPPDVQVQQLEAALSRAHLDLPETVPLVAALLSLPLPARYDPLTMSPQRQRQQTLDTLLAILLALAAPHPVLFIVEDLHWIDPSTLEFLTLLVDQGPTAGIFTLLTCRPEFRVPWGTRAHLTPITLNRLPRRQVEILVQRVAGGKALPAAVVQQVVARTDGVPLFVEELTKMVLESGLLHEGEERYDLTAPLPPLAIPATLHDSLMARLDRLASVKALAQLGATLGREFAYHLLQAVSPWDEDTLHRGLQQLVAAEFLYQRGLPPQATYTFKHALIQEAAYQSLLKSTRQQYHQRIAQVVEARFPNLCETQPELLAHHYTEAGLTEQAIPYWQQAGRRASERSAYVEAIAHLTNGLDLLETLPETPERLRHELALQTTLGPALMATKGIAAPDVGRAYARARALCRQVEDAPQVLSVLRGLWNFYLVRAEHQTAQELAEQLLGLAERQRTPALILEAHLALGISLFWQGAMAAARAHLEQGSALYDSQQHRTHALLYGLDPGMACLSYAALALWSLGYPDQARQRIEAALTLAQELSHPFSLAAALQYAANLYQLRREWLTAQELAEGAISLSTQQGFPQWLPWGTFMRGWALVAQGQGEEAIAQMRQGLVARLATGAEIGRSYALALLADAYGRAGRVEEGLRQVSEALAHVDATGERPYATEVYRLKGELLLRQAMPDEAQAETCFHQALDVARRQQAKSLELRAATSLSRLWQQQGKRTEAHELLAPIYGWFTEGLDTSDLQEAKALLETRS